MNSRERVLAAMNHREPDRVPIDFSGHRSSGISAMVYPKLRNLLGLKPVATRVYDPIQQLAVVDADVLDRFGVDTLELGRAFDQTGGLWKDWVLPDGTPCQMPAWAVPVRYAGGWNMISSKTGRVIAKMPDGALYMEQTYFPFSEKEDFDNIAGSFSESMWCALPTPPGPLAAGVEGAQLLVERAKALRAGTDKAIIGLFGGNFLEIGEFLYGMENFMLLLAGEPEKAGKFLDRVLELHLSNLEKYLRAVGPYIDIVLFSDDLA